MLPRFRHARTLPALAVLATLIASCLPAAANGRTPAPTPADGSIAATIVRLSQAELAKHVHEIPMGSDNSPDIARYRTAFAWRAPVSAWCGYFASYIAKQAGVPLGARGEGIGYVPDIKTWAQRSGRWVSVPRAGDLAVYPGHVAIVESVAGSMTSTISGNWSDRVSRYPRPRSDALGFVRLAVGYRVNGSYATGFIPASREFTGTKG